ncbi:hypothetical protein HNP73_002908 [Amaricoccus macauensis]|uniref:Uncharacterized protein n=1 Tax=Amaricoccus macauensis TaxID=57001 RepID=A0A840SUY7_9RHOB|nr:hypothetical protein [Amaricoccus macauensis]MBB5222961.1 hypothetical protein [Amaricoccus macauensis]
MPPELPDIVSAQVLVAGNGDQGRVERVRVAWRHAGFETGPAVGGSFSVAAGPARFEALVGRRLELDREGGVLAGGERALPLSRLPDALRDGVSLVSFGRPPSFGPRRR